MIEKKYEIKAILEEKKSLFTNLETAIRAISLRDQDVIVRILKELKPIREEAADIGLKVIEKFIEELEFSLEMMNFAPGRSVMEILLRANSFIFNSLKSLSENDEYVIDEGEINDIIACVVTCHPDLTGETDDGFESEDLYITEEKDEAEMAESEEAAEGAGIDSDELFSDDESIATAPVVMEEDQEIYLDFVEESMDNISSAEIALIKLEEDPKQKESLNEMFRSFHTIKGNSGFLNLTDITELAHRAESLLDSARTGKIVLQGESAQLAYESIDMLKGMITKLRKSLAGGTYETPKNHKKLLKRLDEFNSSIDKQKTAKSASPSAAKQGKKPVLSEMVEAFPEIKPEPMEHKPISQAPLIQKAPQSPVAENKSKLSAEKSDDSDDVEVSSDGAKKLDQKVKVSTIRMDNLIDAVGELVIANAMVVQEKEIAETTNTKLARNVSHMVKIVRELQEMAMSLRMVSLKATFQKMARIVRDLSFKTGCPVDFTYSGEDTELDRNVVEEIGNPLVHMVRNAVDHGIESPDVRKKIGKPEKGSVHLSSYHEGGSVIIKITDDGKGLDKDRILAKAKATGIIKSETEISEREIYYLIFHPGFSTAEKVTDLSGRGVGMDVVKKSIDGLRGRIDIQTEQGKGTSFTIRLPLTLAIIDGVIVKVATERYIIPTLSIIESVRAKREQLSTVSGKGEIFSLRGELLPLYRLHNLFELTGAKEDPTEGLIVVAAGDGFNYALLVDELIGKQQVVIKALDKTFNQVDGISGGAIMGDGLVALIIDPQRICRMVKRIN